MPDWIVGSYLKQASLIIVDWFVAKCLFRCRGQVHVFFCFFLKFLKPYSFKILEWGILFPFLRERKQNYSASLSLFSDKLPLQLNCRENISRLPQTCWYLLLLFFFFNYRKVFKQTYADLAGSQVFPTKNTRLFVQPNVKWNLMFTTYTGPLQSQFGV